MNLRLVLLAVTVVVAGVVVAAIWFPTTPSPPYEELATSPPAPAAPEPEIGTSVEGLLDIAKSDVKSEKTPTSTTEEPGAAVNPAAPTGGTIAGAVRDEEGQALSGIVVHAVRPRVNIQGHLPMNMALPIRVPDLDAPENRAETDAGGSFQISGLDPGRYSLVARGQGYQQRQLDNVEVTTTDPTRVDVAMAVGLSIEGIVVDPDGNPVPGAQVTAGAGMITVGNGMQVMLAGPGGRDRKGPSTKTDARGRFQLDGLGSGNQSLKATHDDWAPGDSAGIAAGSRGVEIQLLVGATVAGVVYSPEGKPVPDAEVSFTMYGSRERPEITDRHGRFERKRVRPGHLQMVVKSDGFPVKFVRGIEVADGEELTDLEIQLEAGTTLTGVVVDPRGQPLADASIQVGSASRRFFIGRNRATSDAEGRFTLPGLQTGGSFKGKVAHPDYLATDIETFDANTPALDLGTISVREGSAISGRVLDDTGQPVAGASVRAASPGASPSFATRMVQVESIDGDVSIGGHGEPRATTDESGAFRLAPLEAGEYQLKVKTADFAPYEGDLIVLDESSERSGVEVTLTRGVDITGRVVDADGQPVAGAKVEASRYSPNPVHTSTTTDAEGAFRLAGLDDGTYDVRASHGQLAPASSQASTGGSPLELMLLRNGAISGIVVDKATGLPVESFAVKLQPKSDGNHWQRGLDSFSFGAGSQFQDPNGEFVLTDVAPGLKTLQIRSKGYTLFEEEVEIPSGDEVQMDIALDLGGAIEGVVVDKDGQPIAGARISRVGESSSGGGGFMIAMNVEVGDAGESVSAISLDGSESVTTDEEGRFLLDSLPAGEIKISVKHRSHIDTEVDEIKVAKGETRTISRIELERGGTIHGTVTDAEGAIVTHGNVTITLAPEDGDGRGGPPQFVPLSKEGKFRQGGLPSGVYRIKVHRWGDGGDVAISLGSADSDREVRLRPDEEKKCDIRLR